MRRKLGLEIVAIAAALAVTTPSRADDTGEDPLRRLPHRRPIEIDAAELAGRWITVLADDSLAAATNEFADVRVSDDAGHLVPHFTTLPRDTDVRWRALGSDSLTWHDDPNAGPVLDVELESTTVSALVVIPDAAALGRPASIHVLGGRTGRRWAPLEAEVSTLGDVTGTLTVVRLPARPPRHVRLVGPTNAGASLPGAMLYTESTEPAPRRHAAFTPTAELRGDRWGHRLDLVASRWVAGVVVEPTDESAFNRLMIELEVAPDRWRSVDPGETQARRRESNRHVTFSPQRASGIRVSVVGAGGATAPFTPLAVEVVPTRIVLRVPSDATRLWINYGDPFLGSSGAVEQDVVMRTEAFELAALGPEVTNPRYSPPGIGWEWVRRHPAVLTVVMVLILVAVAAIVLQDARRRT